MPNLFMVDLEGTEISELEKEILQHPNVGALILFTRNFKDVGQLKQLINQVRLIRSDIFIAIDHEGGIVQRFQRHGFRCLPAARVYGDLYSINPEAAIQLAFQYGKTMAEDLLTCGIDLSLAPVLDLHGESEVIGKLDRAFHHDPDVVTRLAEAFIQGMHAAGMPAVGKHFPGHGSCNVDSHVAKPIFDISEDQLRNVDLKPFHDLIKKGLLSAIMPAHIIYSAIDPDNPAGFSKIWLQTILRGEFNFQGLVLSDCLSMKGADIGDMRARSERALEAGCDMLIVCNQPRTVLYETLQTVKFKRTKMSESRIEKFKQEMVKFKSVGSNNDNKYLNILSASNIPEKPDTGEETFNKTLHI